MANATVSIQRLRDLRTSKGWSQRQLSEESGVGKATIARMETEEKYWDTVTPRTIALLSLALEAPKEYILGEEVDFVPVTTLKRPAPVTEEEFDWKSYFQGVKEEIGRASNIGYSVLKNGVDVTTPFTTRRDLPRPAHLDETWEQQAACFLEGQRQAYINWLNRNTPFEDLLKMMVKEAQSFGTQHGIDVGALELDIEDEEEDHGDNSFIGVSDILYQWSNGFLGLGEGFEEVGTGADFRPGTEVETIEVGKATLDDGTKLDKLLINDEEYYIACKHDTDSDDVDDHLYQIQPKQVKKNNKAGKKRATSKAAQ